jgi:hypothetical protein
MMAATELNKVWTPTLAIPTWLSAFYAGHPNCARQISVVGEANTLRICSTPKHRHIGVFSSEGSVLCAHHSRNPRLAALMSPFRG